MTKNNSLDLNNFFPYQLSKLQTLVSDNIAQVYTGKFDLTKQEWRVLAILANETQLTATQIGQMAELEKMPTSRAISNLLSIEIVEKTENSNDKRSSLLKLSTRGKELFAQLAPIAKQKEQQILCVLTKVESEMLNKVISKLTEHSEYILKSLNETK